MGDIRGFIFDMDGVLADTMIYHYRAWQQLGEEVGIAIEPAALEQLRGISREQSLQRLLRGRAIDPQTAEEWMNRKNTYFLAYLQHFSPANVLPGVRAFLEDARADGYRLGVASSSRNARAVLQKIGLWDLFDIIGDGTTAVPPKPAPDLFLWVARQLGLEAQQIVIVEDSAECLAAARDNGFWTLYIGPTPHPQAHLSYPSLQGRTPRAIAQQLIYF